MKYELYNRFIKFGLYLEKNADVSKLENYLGPYINIKEETNKIENEDLNIHIINSEEKIFNADYVIVDNHKIKLIDNDFYILIDNYTEEEWLFIKRVIIDLCNRFFEKKGGLFLHSSSIVENGNTVTFIGQKGTGKTTNMLYMLNNFDVSYSSNERTGLMVEENKIITYGNPSKINIRANTLKTNDSLRAKLINSIDMEKYSIYEKKLLSRDCSERLEITFRNIEKEFNRKVVPVANLKIICNLLYSPSVVFHMEKTKYNDIKEAIESSVIDGVYPKRKELNEIFPIVLTTPETIFKNSNILYYNIYHNDQRDNSENIYKILKKELENNGH